MDLVAMLRLAYLGASALVVVIALIPPFRSRFLAYGARIAPVKPTTEADKTVGKPSTGVISTALDRVAEVRVPHNWFTSFYVVCVGWSLVWVTQLLTKGPLFQSMADATASREGSMSFRQVVITWAILLVQGSRRLYESFEFARPTRSQMWFVHWILGIAFYTATAMAVWVEGIPAIKAQRFTLDSITITITTPSIRTFLSILLFILASGFQHDCHAYLASLKPKRTPSIKKEAQGTEYKLPEHPAFHYLIAPHYFAECLIYIALAFIAAPAGARVNGTVGCALVFVVVNLGATADVTREWYRGRFGEEGVRGKWRMVPWVY